LPGERPVSAWDPEGRLFTVSRDGQALAGEALGEGPAVVLLHGITASRRYVVHGSKLLPRKGFETLTYDARGHGDSSPAPEGSGYTYGEMSADVGAVLDAEAAGRAPVLAGHSMGCHTAAGFALRNPDRLAGIVLIGPAYPGLPSSDEALASWDELAEGLERGGIEGFLAAYERQGLDPEWRDTLIRITRERLLTHRHPDAVAQAMREVPRDVPFDGLEELEFLELPALVVASHDEADPGHPHAVAEAYAERLPRARLAGETEGESPLAWQGGRLSREIARFCEQPEVAERLAG
jgi:pimeloyl-ACP methyl ester carboxylesterase